MNETNKIPEYVNRQAKYELARRDFFYYCNLMAPDFYKKDRKYLVDMCNKLQEFIKSDAVLLAITLPPRCGKSRTSQKFVEWLFGTDETLKVMTASYNETLSMTFARGVRNTIMERKGDEDIPVYTDVFPTRRIKDGEGSAMLWSLEGGNNNYLATSPSGTSTGFGANYILVDDIIKNAEEAYNDNVLEGHWKWFTETMLSRLEKGGKIIVIMTRWRTADLAGRLIKHFTELGKKVVTIKYKALQDDGTMLCDDILDKETYEMKKATIGREIFLANYQQEPLDVQGRLYSAIKTYDDVPRDSGGTPLFREYKAYIDTADTGKDYLCAVAYGVYNGDYYVLDLIYTQEPMEITEPLTAEMLDRNNIRVAEIESNNGGRGFARNVDALLKERFHNRSCMVRPFSQGANKEARILSNATNVMQHIFFPKNWEDKWREFATSVLTFQKGSKNEHDDAEDVLTGIIEKNLNKPIRINPRILNGY